MSKRLLEQDPRLASRREELLIEKNKFERARDLLNSLEDFEG